MIDTPAAGPVSPPDSIRRRGAQPLVPLVLLILALIDLRVEILLLLDRFTITALLTGMRHHWLAVAVLVLQPSLWRRYGRSPR
jgi:hypothetical protein